mmetsp:Transcript_2796/g.3964  ORF Transcript_2796/g.3964 Transcript_2796/m.3964 type:complete len:100 (-) Transcript_2796:682-981(-)
MLCSFSVIKKQQTTSNKDSQIPPPPPPPLDNTIHSNTEPTMQPPHAYKPRLRIYKIVWTSQKKNDMYNALFFRKVAPCIAWMEKKRHVGGTCFDWMVYE